MRAGLRNLKTCKRGPPGIAQFFVFKYRGNGKPFTGLGVETGAIPPANRLEWQ